MLASHSGNMEAAAMDLVEMDRAGFRGNSGSSSPADKTSADAGDHKKSAAETSFWNDVLGDVTVDEEEEEESEAAIETDARAFFAAVDGATPYASWPADQWAAVEVNVLGTLTEDLNQAEKLVGWRPAPHAPDADDEDAVELLVKWKGRALVRCSWVHLPALAAGLNLAAQRLAKFWEKHPKSAGPVVAVQRECLEVTRVLATREGGEVLVRWGGGLGCEEATWEPESWVRTNAAAQMAQFEEVTFQRVAKATLATAAIAENPIAEEDLPPTREWYGCEGNVLRGYQREGVRWMAHNLLSDSGDPGGRDGPWQDCAVTRFGRFRPSVAERDASSRHRSARTRAGGGAPVHPRQLGARGVAMGSRRACRVLRRSTSRKGSPSPPRARLRRGRGPLGLGRDDEGCR